MKPRTSKAKVPRRVLVVDIGGSHVKFRVGTRGRIQRFDSGPDLTPAQMVSGVTSAVPQSSYDAISVGYPGVVMHGRIVAEPHNLGTGWVHFDFDKAFGKPIRLINDAAMQAIGSYRGGRMLFLGLGTGMGSTLIAEGYVEPMEVGHMPYKQGRSYEEYVGEGGRKHLGNRKWRKAVRDIIDQLCKTLEVDYVVVGGGNARRLKKLGPSEYLGDNDNAFVGGLRLWACSAQPLHIDPQQCVKSSRRLARSLPRGARKRA